jgi:hypothetical protein
MATILVLLVLGGAVLAGLGAAQAAQTAKLHLLTIRPLTVVGTGFHASERARVTATTNNQTQTIRVIASRVGGFRVTFDELTASRCGLIRVVAVRQAGSVVALKRLPSPACLPMASPGAEA